MHPASSVAANPTALSCPNGEVGSGEYRLEYVVDVDPSREDADEATGKPGVTPLPPLVPFLGGASPRDDAG